MTKPIQVETDAYRAPGACQIGVLGTRLEAVTYETLARRCEAAARADQSIAIEFANTQVITMRRHHIGFRRLTEATDWFVPDGMPLVWCMNRAGAGLSDRVYGPTFFKHFLSRCPAEFGHYLLGGSPACGERLLPQIRAWNPGARILGSFHGACRPDGTVEGIDPAEEINRLAPNFIWVGLGTPKQQAWIHANKSRLRRGVLCSVGFAFDVHAGLKSDAPPWMQRMGLTWLFRMATEPRRLAGRYLRYNALFLAYLLLDAARGRAWVRSESVQSVATQDFQDR